MLSTLTTLFRIISILQDGRNSPCWWPLNRSQLFGLGYSELLGVAPSLGGMYNLAPACSIPCNRGSRGTSVEAGSVGTKQWST